MGWAMIGFFVFICLARGLLVFYLSSSNEIRIVGSELLLSFGVDLKVDKKVWGSIFDELNSMTPPLFKSSFNMPPEQFSSSFFRLEDWKTGAKLIFSSSSSIASSFIVIGMELSELSW